MMMKRFHQVSCLLLIGLLFHLDTATAKAPATQVQVKSPAILTKPGGYDHRESLFGTFPYGSTSQHRLYYVKDDPLCSVSPDSQDLLWPQNTQNSDDNNTTSTNNESFILLIDRGGCTFVHKVRNAQQMGAAAALLADNLCLCSAGDTCHPSAPGQICEQVEPVMADDGSGGDVTIPSMLLFKPDADALKEVLLDANHTEPVMVELTFAVPAPDDRVEYTFWFMPTPEPKKTVQFLTHFQDYAQALGPNAYFTPHYFIYDGIESGCHNKQGENVCLSLCTNNGRYCATDPGLTGASGINVIEESLRQICIWSHYGQMDGVGAVWWDYVSEFFSNCATHGKYNNTDCIDAAYQTAGVDAAKINACIQDSGGLEDNSNTTAVNSKLQMELKAKKEAQVGMVPSALINGVAVRGATGPAQIFEAICAGYAAGTAPAICHECLTCQYVSQQECVVQGQCQSDKNDNASGDGSSSAANDAMDMWNDVIQNFGSDFEDCGMDLGSLLSDDTSSGGDIDNPTPADFNPTDILDKLKFSEPCSNTQKTTFRDSLLEFQTCSGYELVGLLDVLPAALAGAVQKCMNSLTLADFLAKDINHACAEAILGNHPLGKALRGMLLHASETSTCLDALALQVPLCSLDLWPVPIDGTSIKTGACILSKLEGLLDAQCKSAVLFLDQCLPKDKDEITSGYCDSYASACSGDTNQLLLGGMMMLPKHLQGIPIPESCAMSAANPGVTERYDAFRSACATEGLQLWNKLDNDPSSSEDDLATFKSFLEADTKAVNPKSNTHEPSNNSTANVAETENTEESSTAVGKSLTAKLSSFAYGLAGGIILSAVSFFAFVIVRAKRRGNGWNSVVSEMTFYDQVPDDSLEFS